MPVAWHPNRSWKFCMSEGEKKEIDPISIEELYKCSSVVYNMHVLGPFCLRKLYMNFFV